MLRTILISLRTTWQNFVIAKLRTFLTVLGIMIGISAIFIVMSVGSSAQNILLDQVRDVGSNLMAILPGASDDNGPPASALGISVTTLKNSDLEALRNETNFPFIEAASGYVTGNKSIRYKNNKKNTNVQGVSADLINIENLTIAEGRFFTEDEEERGSRLAVLGATIATDLFDEKNPQGETIRIDKNIFRVIGVFEERGSTFTGSYDDVVYVPLTTAQQSILGIDYLNFIRIKVSDESHIAATENEITATLKDRHNLDEDEEGDFSIRNVAAALDILSSITNIMKYFLIAVAGIALVVGGIGVMNMMLITLHRRIREIGLRKAIGARTIDIITQFLAEAIIIAVAGGLIGILSGVGISYIVAMIAQSSGLNWGIVLAWEIFAVSFGVAFFTGLVFGIYPAIKASRISPMEALRYE